MTHYPIRADEYRARATAEATLGAAASLEQVRAKHERAAQVWTELADTEDARAAERIARAAASVLFAAAPDSTAAGA